MARKRSAELEREIREALSQIQRKPSLKTREQLDAEIDTILAGGLPAERYEVARALGFQYPKRPPPKKMTVTDTNIFALAEVVLKNRGRSTFPNRFERVDYPHIKRTLAGGLVTVSSPTTLTLTSEGRDAVLHRLRRDYDRVQNRTPGGAYTAAVIEQERERLREAIANLELS